MKKKSEFLIWNFSVLGGEIFYIFEQACFRNELETLHTDWTNYLYKPRQT